MGSVKDGGVFNKLLEHSIVGVAGLEVGAESFDEAVDGGEVRFDVGWVAKVAKSG